MTFQEEHALETYKSLVTVSMEGLKAAFFVNGGAIVALLAFLGQSDLGPKLAQHFWWPMVCFVLGVSFSTLAFYYSYRTQLSLYNSHFPTSQYQSRGHRQFLVIGIFLFVLSVASFVVGGFTSIDVFARNIGAQDTEQNSTFVLYRNSVTDENMRIHVATFDADEEPAYNSGNCDQTQKLFQAQPGVKAKFWCEKGRFKK